MGKKFEEEVNENPTEVQKEDSKQLVDKKAYDEVTKDMLKYKQAMREQQEELRKLREEKDNIQKQELIKNQEFQRLFENTEKELQRERSEKQAEKNKFVNYHKKQAVIEKLGGFKRAEYANFIQVDSIEVNENGDIDQISLQREVDRIRQNYPDLLNTPKQSLPATPALPSAPVNTEVTVENWKKMSEQDKKAARLKMLTSKKV